MRTDCLLSSRCVTFPIFSFCLTHPSYIFFFFFFNDTATTEIYTLSLHDALPICTISTWRASFRPPAMRSGTKLRYPQLNTRVLDRKSTRLNSSHLVISYAVFCLKKKKKKETMCNRIEYNKS